MKIKKTTIEWLGIILLFLLSFINEFTLLLFLVLLLLFLMQKEVGALKIINMITLRTIINPGIGIDISRWQNIKWLLLFLVSFYLVKSYFLLNIEEKKKVRYIGIPFLVFVFYNAISSLAYSTLPTVAIFKLISYSLIFLGVFIGVSYTSKKYDWVQWMNSMFLILMFFSLVTVKFPIAYLRNGHAFQGITNQPNMFGIVTVLFISITLANSQRFIKGSRMKLVIIIIAANYLIILSESRTALIASMMILLIYTIYSNYMNKIEKIISINFLSIVMIVFLVIDNSLIEFIKGFIYKGNSSLLYSRLNQIDGLLENFLRNPLFGSGFSVPVIPYRTFSFSTEFVVEPGNLILSVLSYSGAVGFCLFLVFLFKVYKSNNKDFGIYGYLLISSLLISMGEMVFFSSNNIGTWIYMYLSLYVFADTPIKNKRYKGHYIK